MEFVIQFITQPLEDSNIRPILLSHLELEEIITINFPRLASRLFAAQLNDKKGTINSR